MENFRFATVRMLSAGTRPMRTQSGGSNISQTRKAVESGPVEAMENHKPVSHRPLEIPQKQRDFHFPTASTAAGVIPRKTRNPLRQAEGDSRADQLNRTDHV